MVVVAPVTKKQMPSKQKVRFIAVIVVVLTAVGSVWIFASSLSSRTGSIKTRASLLKGVRKDDVAINSKVRLPSNRQVLCWNVSDIYFYVRDDQQTHEAQLSAKQVLATGRPYLLYGTAWKKDDTAYLVSRALHSGFRFIDTACQPKHYDEVGVGRGWTDAASELGMFSATLSCHNYTISC